MRKYRSRAQPMYAADIVVGLGNIKQGQDISVQNAKIFAVQF